MKTYKDVKIQDKNNLTSISLEKLKGLKIKDITGYVTTEFDSDSPAFMISKIIFENDEEFFVNGEHDIAYIEGSITSDEELVNILKTDPDYVDEDEGSND